MRHRMATVALAACWVTAVGAAAQDAPQRAAPRQPSPPARITVDATAPRRAVSPEMYGIFFEEINHAGDGGLYAELVRNRDFEAGVIPEGWRVAGEDLLSPLGWRTRNPFTEELPGWSLVAENGAEGSIARDAVLPLNARNPNALRLTVTKPGTRCGVANDGYWGMNVEAGEWYDVTFYARTEGGRRTGLVFSLESRDGRTIGARATIPEVGEAKWQRYTLALHARASEPRSRLVITPLDPGTIWLDVVSVFPRRTFKDRPNGMRRDLAEMLAALKPGFLRFPGGCVVEGATLATRIRWKDSIGDIAERRGEFDLWGYYNTNGLGFHEYLQLAEDLGAPAMYVVNAGMSCQARPPAEVARGAELQPYVQDTLDALEYALGPTTSTWGALRARNGHPAPFPLKYVEIGNENHGPDYRKNYKVFYDAIKARYPQIVTIADERMPENPVEIVDDHFYAGPRRFFEMADFYDAAPRGGPKIYVGEYAVNRGVGTGNLLGALAEAVFLLNMERNADVVRMCSYAPLFENVNRRDWPVNLIRFDSARSFGRSSYHVQRLFAANRPDAVLRTEVQAAEASLDLPQTPQRPRPGGAPPAPAGPARVRQLYALAGLDQKRNELVVKVVNPTPDRVTAAVTLRGLTGLGRRATITTLGHADATTENTLDAPRRIAPVESTVVVSGPAFSHAFPPNSLTVLRLPARAQ